MIFVFCNHSSDLSLYSCSSPLCRNSNMKFTCLQRNLTLPMKLETVKLWKTSEDFFPAAKDKVYVNKTRKLHPLKVSVFHLFNVITGQPNEAIKDKPWLLHESSVLSA